MRQAQRAVSQWERGPLSLGSVRASIFVSTPVGTWCGGSDHLNGPVGVEGKEGYGC